MIVLVTVDSGFLYVYLLSGMQVLATVGGVFWSASVVIS